MKYQCHPGYTLSGRDTLTCKLSAQLQFEGVAPTCEGRHMFDATVCVVLSGFGCWAVTVPMKKTC